VFLDDAGTQYKVERFRKHATQKNGLFVWQLDPGGGKSIPLHKGTERETQEVILKIMGSSLDVFVGSIYAGQEAMPDLPGMTDKHLKLLVEEAAGVEELADAYTEACKQTLVVEKELAVAFTQRDNVKIQLTAAQEALQEAIDQQKLFEDTRRDRAKTELAHVPKLQADLKDVEAELASVERSALDARHAALSAKLAARGTEEAEQRRLAGLVAAADRNVTAVKTRAQHAKHMLDTAIGAVAKVEALVGKPCNECGKPYCEHDLEEVKKLRDADVARLRSDLGTQVTAARIAIDALNKAKGDLADFEAGMTDVSAATAELQKVGDAIHTHNQALRNKRMLEDGIDAVKKAATAKLSEPNPWTAHLTSRQAKVDALETKQVSTEADVEILEARHARLKESCAVFGPAGVRAHVLDTVTPFLNHQTGEYLGALADGNIHATWSTLTANAKGELKEKFSIAVENDHGGKSFGLQSGGEKRKVRIATALALQDMVASRATKPINIFIADEVDHALDDSGLERLMGVLDRKAKERGTVLVISHNALSDWIDQTITVTKSGGKSTVTGATVAGF
jgi:DNA repair exonuclease SbcCD ATPase subunit